MDSDDETTNNTRYSMDERLRNVLKILRDGRISLVDFILEILDPRKAEFSTYRTRFFSNQSGKLDKLLNRIFEDQRGRTVLFSHAVKLVSNKIAKEMDEVKATLEWKINDITPTHLLTWDIDSFIGPLIDKSAPVLGQLLQVAAQTKRAKENNKIKSCVTARNVIVTQLAKERLQRSQYFAAPFTLFLWTNGASRQTIEALYKCGLCISFSTLDKLLEQLASQSLERAHRVGRGLHALCWDNINIKMSTFVEQRDSAPAKVQSGTFAILYEVCNGNPTDMRLSPMVERAQRAIDLTFYGDIRPTEEQETLFYNQTLIHVVDILLAWCPSFEEYQRPDGSIFDHPERRKRPTQQTKQFPLRTSTIDESSVAGNIAVVRDVYINQLKMTYEELSDRAVPSINDQSTNARIRGGKALRAKDINTFTRLQFLQLGFGLFHLTMNLIWALLHVHRGSIEQEGSLSYFFALLDRTRLGTEHPDYHTLLSTLLQILRGIILDAWRVECGYPSLAAFAASNPSADDLLQVAEKIIQNHAFPSRESPIPKPKKKANASNAQSVPAGHRLASEDDDCLDFRPPSYHQASV